MKAYLAAIALAALVPGAALAEQVTIEYTYDVQYIGVDNAWGETAWVDSTNLMGFDVAYADRVTTRVTYDTSQPLELISGTPELGTYALQGKFGYSVQFQNSPTAIILENESQQSLWVRTWVAGNGTYFATYTISGGNAGSRPSAYQIGGFEVPTGSTPFTALPRAGQVLGPVGGHPAEYYYNTGNPSAPSVYLRGVVTSAQVISSVPEPATWGLMLAGLPLVLLRRKVR